jgi:hypothetical protein
MTLLAQALLVAWLLTWLPLFLFAPTRWRLRPGGSIHPLLLVLTVLMLGILSADNVPSMGRVAAIPRALWGDPSITTMQLLILCIFLRPPTAFTRGWHAPALLAAFSLIFYPLCLGLGDFDPYRTGFQPAPLLTVLAVPALLLWWRGQPLWLWLLAVDLLAFALGLLESTNFWDYLIDPLLAFACIILAARNYAASRREQKTQAITENHHE